ncbi:MAG: PAS domain S-box protein, partial [Chloroflexi bacterium]|nr:PAS domain S-box protein [Chloroflexota bacterium]
LFDNLPQGVAVYKMVYNRKGNPVDFVLLESNRAYDHLHSFNRDRIGKKTTEFNPKIKKDSIDWVSIYGRVATTGAPEYFEIYSKPTDKWYQVYIYSPKKTFFVSVFMDITEQKKRATHEIVEQKKSEQQLLLSEKKYRRLYETTQDGIMARDIQGKMIDCNFAYAKMLGYSKKELRQLAVQQLIPEKWHEQRERIVKKVLKSGHSILFEREYTRKDGSIFSASVRTWRLTDGKGKVVGIWSIVRDITEQKQLQNDLQEHAGVLQKIVEDRTKQLKDSERLAAIGQTAGMVGHDLRNPLQTITGELYLAKNAVNALPEGEAKSSLQESLQVIDEQAVYMDKIVSDLQAFVQPVKIDKKPVSLKELVTNVLASVAVPENIAVKIVIRENFPQIKADLHLLKRVLINLVTNSVQAMPDGGKLTLTGRVNPDSQVSVSIQDTGVGIPEAIKNKIFTPLFTTKPRGQGFGLAVCKRVIEAHGGTISFESQAGNGAKFTIQFPAS